MARNTLIRNPSNTSPFTPLEIRILEDMENLLKGENFSTKSDRDMVRLDEIKNIYGLSKKEAMYIAALYRDNWYIDRTIPYRGTSTGIEHESEKVDWAGFEEVEVPEMKLYEVEYFQDVSAYRDVYFDVWGSDEEFADLGASHDFYYDEETFTEKEESEIEHGDYGDVYDSEVRVKSDQQDIGDSLMENRKIIKKILNEYRRKI